VTFHTCREHVEVLRGGALFEVRRDSDANTNLEKGTAGDISHV